jgi:hypothetical protein
MDSSKAKRREGSPQPERQDAAHGTVEKEEADFRRNGRNMVKKVSLRITKCR